MFPLRESPSNKATGSQSNLVASKSLKAWETTGCRSQCIEIRVTFWENSWANGCLSLDKAGRLPLAFREAPVIIRTYEQYGTSQAPAQGKTRGSDPDAGHSPHSPGGSQPGQAGRLGCVVAGVQAVMRTLHGLFLHQKRPG